MQGVRQDNPNSDLPKPGVYGRDANGDWYGCPPQVSDDVLIANLSSHTVIEHEDGAITVSPSILITSYDGRRWHGFLEHGAWREV